MQDPKEHVVEIGRRMDERWSANAAGGNISLRVEDQIYISPRFADYKW
jgi:ribulose-5-phosphate 4-epimerase/fuculose-1-phosphate aldolase